MSSAFNSFVNNACQVLLITPDTMGSWNENQELFQRAGSENSNLWLNGSPPGTNIPWIEPSEGDWQPDTNRPIWYYSGQTGDDLRNFITGKDNNYFNNPAYFWEFCSAFITQMESALAQDYKSDTDGPILGSLQSMGTQVQAAQSTENTLLTTEAQSSASILSNVNQSATPASNACDAVIGMITNGASAQQQIAA